MKIRTVFAMSLCVFVAAPLFAQGPPAESGPIVVRDDAYGFWWYMTDFKRGYVAFIGADPVSICMGGFAGDWWNFQENYPPAEEGLVHLLLKGNDVQASVYPASIWDYGLCAYILTYPPLAEGTVDALYNDNDLVAGAFDHHRHNTWKLTFHGVVTAPDGEEMILNGGFHCTFDPDFTKGKCKTKVVLN